jgi:hypothetical protein
MFKVIVYYEYIKELIVFDWHYQKNAEMCFERAREADRPAVLIGEDGRLLKYYPVKNEDQDN